jgi:hypothetical protein
MAGYRASITRTGRSREKARSVLRHLQFGIMTRHIMVAVISIGFLASSGFARDPGDTPTRVGGRGSSSGRGGGTPSGSLPERIDPSVLHPPTHVDPPEPPLYQRVESDVDRGTGRIEDEHTLQLRRREEDLDFPPGRQPQADLKRDRRRRQEDIDRGQRLDRRAIQADDLRRLRETAARDAAAANRTPRAEPAPQPMGSVMTRYVAQESRRLDDARQKYQSDLSAAEAERDEAVRTAPTRETRAAAERRFDQRRLDLTRGYHEYRKKVLGTD